MVLVYLISAMKIFLGAQCEYRWQDTLAGCNVILRTVHVCTHSKKCAGIYWTQDDACSLHTPRLNLPSLADFLFSLFRFSKFPHLLLCSFISERTASRKERASR